MLEIIPYLAIVIVILTGWGIVKNLQVNILLLFSGLALNLLAILAGVDSILPRNVHSTGWVGFDLFELLRALSRSQVASTGFVILVAGGFAAYMDKIGASDKLVALCMKPLSHLKNPYIVLGAVFLLGHILGLVVTSAAGLAMLLAVSVYPLLIGLGISSVSAAAVIGSVLVFSYIPSSAIAILTAQTAGGDPMVYLIEHQLPVAIPTIIVMVLAHIFVQSYLDKKDAVSGRLSAPNQELLVQKQTKAASLPNFYALLPLVPLFLLFIFNKLVFKTVVLDVATAMFIGWVFGIVVDLVYRRNVVATFKDGAAMFAGMGNMLTNVVGLIFVAALFAAGLQNTGLVNLLIEATKNAGLGLAETGLVLSAVIAIVTILTGSGVASFTGLVGIAPTVATGLGGEAIDLAMMMQLASEMTRPISPVAGVIIIVAGFASVSPIEVVRRTAIPCLVGLFFSLGLTVFLM